MERGMKKWRPFAAMPEQFERIQELVEAQNQMKHPVLDEQRLQELNEIIDCSMAETQALSFRYYKKGYIRMIVGYIHYYDEYKKQLRIMDLQQQPHILPIHQITDVETVEMNTYKSF
ncbi:YolD-like family protein [Bacillus sp. 165]|uniref:YolD-like family protein n=1 Tax=Bacillus sp. 165 TaxID=1529117 RepID=UPI001ADA5309|nr:YolD-like family protein [Bacillus sp. 165]MBO9129370.1 YolD-like family protein [Bacillus sp. 165]